MQHGMLHANGAGRGTVYTVAGHSLPTPDDVFGPPVPLLPPLVPVASSSILNASSSVLSASSSDLSASSSVLHDGSPKTQQRDEHGRLITDQLQLPVINDLSTLSPSFRQQLEELASKPRHKKRIPMVEMKEAILSVCDEHFVTLQVLAELLNRKPDSLRNGYLTSMVKGQLLSLAFPTTPTHARQAYCTALSLPYEPAPDEYESN